LMYIPNQYGNIDVLGASIPVFQFIAGLVFTIASITDYLDGYLARKHNLITSFGEFFDPMADKLLVIAALIMLVQAKDRKSTRLNSSHVSISYAVFCLKKKSVRTRSTYGKAS